MINSRIDYVCRDANGIEILEGDRVIIVEHNNEIVYIVDNIDVLLHVTPEIPGIPGFVTSNGFKID